MFFALNLASSSAALRSGPISERLIQNPVKEPVQVADAPIQEPTQAEGVGFDIDSLEKPAANKKLDGANIRSRKTSASDISLASEPRKYFHAHGDAHNHFHARQARVMAREERVAAHETRVAAHKARVVARALAREARHRGTQG